MLTVYKYPIPAVLGEDGLDYDDTFELSIPNPGIITKLGIQPAVSSQFQIWALVDPEKRPTTSKFLLLTTGRRTKQTNLFFIDSWVSDGTVLHLFRIHSH